MPAPYIPHCTNSELMLFARYLVNVAPRARVQAARSVIAECKAKAGKQHGADLTTVLSECL
jgi:hypothetical protein